MPGRLACLVLGLGIGALTITPICTIIVCVITGDDWHEVLHDIAT